MRLLFITATRVGDAVLSTGVLQHLLAQYPDARVTVAAGRAAASLFEAVPGLERILVIEKRALKMHWLGLWAATARHRWDLIVDLRASAIGYLLPAHRRVMIGPRDETQHRVAELAALLDIDPPPAPRVWLAARHEAAAARLVPDGPPVLALGPTANYSGKQWRAERFAELARRLTAPGGELAGARVAVLALGHERDRVRPLLETLPAERLVDLVGAVDLPAAAACLRRCRIFLGNDSGLMHLAAATGTPTLGLFGPSDERRYGPWGGHAAAVRSPESCAELNRLRVPRGEYQESLMDGLTVEAVLEAARSLLGRTRGT